ncbi:hypothetical protein BBJ28_00014071, partial [Nothophytophthora sp. Chile5]
WPLKAGNACGNKDQLQAQNVERFGEIGTKESVRTQLLAFYTRTRQLTSPRKQQTDLESGVSEMTLRIDTELELLRRQCFAERNAQWGNAMPDQFAFVPAIDAVWKPQPANEKLALRALREAGALGNGVVNDKKDTATTTLAEAKQKREKLDFPLGQFARDRPWPPREFALKPTVKPSRARGGKRKSIPAVVALERPPLLAKTCRQCHTQSTPLWRTQTRTVLATRKIVNETPVAGVSAVGSSMISATSTVANGASAAGAAENAKLAGNAAQGETEQQEVQVQVDVCLTCYLKLERGELFQRKRLEIKRKERARRDGAAAAAQQEKKRLKQQIQMLKKQQKQQKKQELLAAQQAVTSERSTDEVKGDAVMLKFSREEIEAATATEGKKRDRKRGRKEKKKKKHRRKYEESESDGVSPLPSPAQMDGYEYADRVPEPYAAPSTSAFDTEEGEAVKGREDSVTSDPTSRQLDAWKDDQDYAAVEEAAEAGVTRTSSRARRTSKRGVSPAKSVESTASGSKKRKVAGTSRTPRSKRGAASAAAAPVIVAAAPPVPSARKRSRTKKELTRERELRALGQYCPVCNEVYEEDDESTFVCCDSCELWVHGACDSSLSPELIASMAASDDKYICPLCAGR